MKIKLIAFILSVVILSGCSVSPQASEKQIIEVTSPDVETDNASQMIWDKYAKDAGSFDSLIGIPQEPDLLPLYLEGLKHSSAVVRWYSANKLVEYDYIEDKHIITEELEKLQKDADEKVKSAAYFALSAITKSFIGDRFTKSSDGKRVAFYRYNEIAYNDGNIFIFTEKTNGALYSYHVDGSITKMTWSPDGNKLCVEYGGRSWHFVSMIDLSSYQVKDVGLFSQIMKKQDEFSYRLIMNPRVDPQITLLEWSPRGDKMLLFYSFTDDDYKLQSGTAIYQVEKDNFVNIKPYTEEADEGVEPRKPEGFKWEE
ncbi:MAG: hypothetical protein K0Q99_2043 [Clostridia bacterium]|nr:hypothetical protein [Clostridia bacterium]